MVKDKNETPTNTRPDEIQREIWQYRRVWITIIILLIVARIVFPHLRTLRGWEQKFSLAAVEIGQGDIPDDAKKVSSFEEVQEILRPEVSISSDMMEITGPLIVAAWKCPVVGEQGGCIRFLWKGQPLTLVILPMPKVKQEILDPFTRAGWSGYLVVHKGIALAMVGTIEASEIKNAWTFAQTTHRAK